MSENYKTIEIHPDLKREFVDFALEARKRFPQIPDVRKAIITQSGNVISVTLPVDRSLAGVDDEVTFENFFDIAEDMFMLAPGESANDPVAWVA